MIFQMENKFFITTNKLMDVEEVVKDGIINQKVEKLKIMEKLKKWKEKIKKEK